jgi:16S rRNA (cytosine967-C5)-methyltransferase
MSEGLYSRLCALNCLNAVFDRGEPLDSSLEKFAKKLQLSPQDKSFTHALCGFVLRYKHDLQQAVNNAANRKKDVSPATLNVVLLIGAAQIYLMEVPDHAAVDTCVEITKKIKLSKQSGLVNAVLRRLIREDKHDLIPSIPDWLVGTWVKDYGVDVAQNIEQTSLEHAPIGIVNKAGEWHVLGGEFALNDDEWVQDYASYLPVSLLDDLNGKHVLDLCAAPGGKTMQLASKGAHVTSVDISEKRLSRLTQNIERTNLHENVDVVCADILKWKPSQKYDVILIDAPCSATGTIRRHPDLPYIRTQRDIQSLTQLQANLLDKVKNWLADDGVILYCTCSLQKVEGERQIDKFLQNNDGFKRAEIKSHAEWQTLDGDIRLLPTYGEMDGFFISILKN